MLNLAISYNEFSLIYQPKVSLSTERMIGCEALLRWNTKGAGHSEENISPAIFIPIAEESGQINVLGNWVLNTALKQVQRWLELPGFEGMTVSINVSTRQLQRAVFCDRVTELLKKI